MGYIEYKANDLIRDVKVQHRIEGGFGVVYFGQSRIRGVEVAVKTFNREMWHTFGLADSWRRLAKNIEENDFSGVSSLREGDYLLASFFREARMVCQANHASLLRGLGFWQSDEGQPFLETEYSSRCVSLGQWIKDIRKNRRLKPSWLQVVHLAVSVCNGLIYASRELVRDVNSGATGDRGPRAIGFVHRDIKPDNLTCYGRNTVKVIDFGSGRFQLDKQSGPTLLAGRNMAVYTPPYAPAEQMQTFGNLGPSSDVYALAMTAYEMLGGNTDDVQQDTGPRAFKPLKGIPKRLNDILAKCLDFDRWKRYQDFMALKDALAELVVGVREGTISINEGRYCTGCGFIPADIPARTFQLAASGSTAASNGHEFVRVPGGSFYKGCPPDAVQRLSEVLDLSGEEYQSLDVAEFYISKHAVTNEQYRRFVEVTGYVRPEHWSSGSTPFQAGDARKPVIRVSYDDAEAYCRWLGVRMPTGLEWEKAARGVDGRMYPWGNDYRRGCCNSAELGRKGLVGVDEHPDGDSPFGCRQMVGNVMEWVDEPYPSDDSYRYLRGGTWCVSCEYFGLPFMHSVASRRTSRKLSSPNPMDTFGFRVAITHPPQPRTSFHDRTSKPEMDHDIECPLCKSREFADFSPRDLRVPEKNPYTWIGYFDIG